MFVNGKKMTYLADFWDELQVGSVIEFLDWREVYE
jgi:hypothetical protein